jgi:PAS domain S-box-containing protein
MTDHEKTREQLLDEVRALRERVARLEGRDGAPGPADVPPDEPRDFLSLLPLHAPVPIAATAADGRCVVVNRAWEELFGRRGDEAPAGPAARELPQSDRRVLETAAPVTLEEAVDTPQGRRYYQTVKFPLRDAAGQVRAVGGLSMDVTARCQAEERFATIFHASPVAISLTTLAEGRFVDANDSFLRLFGYRREEVIGRTTAELGLWPDRAERPRLVETLRERRSLRHREGAFRARSGEERYAIISMDLVDVGGGPHVLCMVLDITERRRAEQALRESEERLRASEERHRLISELTSDYAYTCRVDADGIITMDSVTEGFQRVLGYTLEEVNARGGWASLIHPDDLAAVAGRQGPLLAGRRGVDEVRVLTRAGETRWIRYSTHPVLDEAQGRVVRLLGAVEDVTGRRRAEEELRDSEERLRGFFEAAFEGLVIHDGGIILDANQRFADLFGYPLAEVLGQSVLALSAAESHEEVRRHICDGDEGPYEAVGRRKDGSTFPGELRGKPITYRGRPARVTAVRDISRRKRAQQQLQEYARRLQALSRRLLEVQESERRALARELHDEIGQLLTGLKLSLERSSRLAAGDVRAALEEAEGLVKDLTGRVRDLSLRLRPTMLDDLGLLPALVWLFERYTAQTRVDVSFEHGPLPGRFPPPVETAAYRIIQEALTNAARHAAVAEVVVRLWADDEALGLQVEDRGAGFDAHGVGAAGTSGGLSGMQERARLLGGRLEVESAPGAGTRVTAELPLGDAVATAADGPAAPAGRRENPGEIP